MRALPICNIVITKLSIVWLITIPFKWDWYFNYCVWLMLLCLMWLHSQNTHMYSMRMINQPSLLNASNTSTNRFTTPWRSLMPSTSNGRIKVRCHIGFRWATKFGWICRNNALSEPIGRSDHSYTGLTPLPRLWVTIVSSTTFPHSLACT